MMLPAPGSAFWLTAMSSKNKSTVPVSPLADKPKPKTTRFRGVNPTADVVLPILVPSIHISIYVAALP